MVRGTKVEIFGLDYCIGTSEKKGEIGSSTIIHQGAVI
jgi:hypothetical protein